jgi:proline racemase
MAQLVALGRLKVGDSFVHESIIGTMFNCRVEGEARVGANPAILPSVAGWARVIGHNTIYVDDRDPLAYGFQLT